MGMQECNYLGHVVGNGIVKPESDGNSIVCYPPNKEGCSSAYLDIIVSSFLTILFR